MKQLSKTFRNKYIVSSLFVVIYILILHDTDIVTLIKRKERVTNLEIEIERKKQGIADLKYSIEQLEDIRLLEKYAREEHLFKKDDEEIFILSFE